MNDPLTCVSDFCAKQTGDTYSARAKVKYADPLTIDEVAVGHPRVKFHDNAVRVFKFPGWKDLE